MRRAHFEVPEGAMCEFARELASRQLNNTIVGVNPDEEVVIQVDYDRNETEAIDELEEVLDGLLGDEDDDE